MLKKVLARIAEVLKTEPAAIGVATGLLLRQLVILDLLHLSEVKQAAIVHIVDLAVAGAVILFIRTKTVTKHTLKKIDKVHADKVERLNKVIKAQEGEQNGE